MTMPFELFGTPTSPFVRRVRVVALEKNVPFTLVDTNTAEGQSRLRAASPVWKVPTARFDDGTATGLVAWDSRVITDVLVRDGWGPMRAPPVDAAGRVDEENVTNAVDEALLSLIRLFYIKKDGFSVDAPFLQKERARADHLLGWLAARVRDGRFVGAPGAGQGFGRAELALVTALAWIRFRDMANVDKHANLVALEAAWADRPSIAATRPGA